MTCFIDYPRAGFRAAFTLWLLAALTQFVAADDKLEFFESRIRPVLVDHCYECHSSETDEPAGGLLLDTREGIRAGGETGPAVVPEDVAESLLISAIEYNDLEMPPDEKLDDDIIEDFRTWIEMGAADPRDGEDHPPEMVEEPAVEKATHWSLQPLEHYSPQTSRDELGAASDIDRFVMDKLTAVGLEPAGRANPLVLLRRLSFDITGLPPTQKNIALVSEAETDEQLQAALESIVDSLLSSPQYGERWARHWLDVARYGESAGSSRDVLMIYSWRYRDYVIDSFNNDISWSDFVRQQVAGDLLPTASEEERRRNLIATGLLAIGSKSLNGGNLTLDIADDQIDVVSKAFLGLTVSCARCHDHKFDPIPTADYYALAGIFRSTETFYGGSTKRPGNLKDQMKAYLPLSPEFTERSSDIQKVDAEVAQLKKKLNPVRKRTQAIEKRLPKDWKKLLASMESGEDGKSVEESVPESVMRQLKLYQKTMAEMKGLNGRIRKAEGKLADLPQPDFAFAVRDASQPRDYPIQIRGERTKSGDIVPRGFLSCIELPEVISVSPQSSGRLELAEWLTHRDHTLTSRVIVNRVWQHLFGVGLVETANNFGLSGASPTHPELLDWLAIRFRDVHHGSLKALIREIVLSATYQQAVNGDPNGWKVDPANQFYWRANRRRLEAEAIRDAILMAGGNLDLNRPGGSVVQEVGEGEVGRNIDTKPLVRMSPHRSVYLPVVRGLLPEFLKVFDFPEPSNPASARSVTNVPTQSLFLMNSPFVRKQSKLTAQQVCEQHSGDRGRVIGMWQRCLSRKPNETEISTALSFVSGWKIEQPGQTDAWAALAQSLIASAEFRFVD